MFPSNCTGCSQAALWPNLNYFAYSPAEMFSFPSKAPSFRISDILHSQNPATGTDFSSCLPVPACSSKMPTASALGPLQAFCTVKRVQNFVAQSSVNCHPTSNQNNSQSGSKQLKFGINRILSEDFGKDSREKEKRHPRAASFGSCSCGEATCSFPRYTRMSFPSPTLTAVHALQPPHYPPSSQGNVDALPGPYSVLNDDTTINGHSKRKRSWSRAVFSNLQRKGLEKRFEVQKYVTKPDRRQLAAMLGLTDAQVKVWFQNRRMKWRHACAQQAKEKEGGKSTESEARESDSDDEPQKVDEERDEEVDDDDDDNESIHISDEQMETSDHVIMRTNSDDRQGDVFCEKVSD